MGEVFIVQIATGEYEEYDCWIDSVFSTHAKAMARVEKLAEGRERVGWYDDVPDPHHARA